jgi:hypothetical protein
MHGPDLLYLVRGPYLGTHFVALMSRGGNEPRRAINFNTVVLLLREAWMSDFLQSSPKTESLQGRGAKTGHLPSAGCNPVASDNCAVVLNLKSFDFCVSARGARAQAAPGLGCYPHPRPLPTRTVARPPLLAYTFSDLKI